MPSVCPLYSWAHTPINCLIVPRRHPRGSTWARVASPHVRVTPHQLHGGPAQLNHFSLFFNEINPKKYLKNQNKIQKNLKIQKFTTSLLELLFASNFLHWITNLFLLEPFFCSSYDARGAYRRKRIHLDSPLWLRWQLDKRVIIGSREVPLEVQYESFGTYHEIYRHYLIVRSVKNEIRPKI